MILFQLFRQNHFYRKIFPKSITFTSFIRNKSDYIQFDKEVTIKTCGNLYEKWKKEKKFKTVPSGDLEFKVSYVDTRRDLSPKLQNSSPIVLALHGAPGSFKDFENLTTYLSSNGVQVVAPSFPEISVYKPGVFRHSAEEKAEFIKDFLKAISVSRVDALVVHSSAVYTGLLLCLDYFPAVKSLIMLNPGTHKLEKMPAMKYFPIMQAIVRGIEVPILYKLLENVAPLIVKHLKLRVRVNDWKDPLLSIIVMVHADIPKSKEKFQLLLKQRLPILYAFSDDDKMIGSSSYDLSNLMEVSDSACFIYDENGSLKQKGQEKPFLKVLCFENGSHYVFWKYADIINREILNFVSKL